MRMMNMRKSALILAAILLMCSLLTGTMFFGTIVSRAEEHDSRVVDDADLLTDEEESELQSKLDEVSERHSVDVVVVTVNDTDGKDIEAFADDYFDYHNYGYGDQHSGVLLCIDMGSRNWHISTTGYGIEAVTDAGISYLGNVMLDDLKSGNYLSAFMTFGENCDELLTTAENGEPYDVGYDGDGDFAEVETKSTRTMGQNLGLAGIISLVLALITAFAACHTEKSLLTSSKPKTDAADYVVPGSFKLSKKQDIFLFTHTTRIKKEPPKSSSGGSHTHVGSSGRSHGGGGGRF